MRKSVQLYSIRNLAEKDLEKALKTISEIGYEGVELACVSIDRDENEIKQWLDKYNLVVTGTHIQADDLLNKTERSIEFYKALGCTRLIIPWYDMDKKADVLEFAEKLKKVAPKLKANNMVVQYHNHAHEFEKDGGECLIDILANETTKDELMLEFDVFWVTTGKENPVTYLEKYKERIDIFHAKDGIDGKGTPLGQGSVDIKGVFEKAKELNLAWAVVESEASEDLEEQVESIKVDYDALVKFIG